MTEKPKYRFTAEDASHMSSIAAAPPELMTSFMMGYMHNRGPEALVDLFSNFIALAHSVVENNREMLELYLISEQGMFPESAAKLNLPTIFGALRGCMLVEGIDQSKTCATCAFRLGTPPNQSPVTTTDADWCIGEIDEKFMCHYDLDDRGNPTRKCTGYTQRMARLRKEEANEN